MNSDVVFHKKDKYGGMTPFFVDSTYIGKCIYTKAVGSSSAVDVTMNYKYPEGNAQAPPPAPLSRVTWV